MTPHRGTPKEVAQSTANLLYRRLRALDLVLEPWIDLILVATGCEVPVLAKDSSKRFAYGSPDGVQQQAESCDQETPRGERDRLSASRR
jgi:hypothetical protein